jgi:hypothetical protein
MTLMPVSRTSTEVDWSTNSGAGRWIGKCIFALIGPRSSTGCPTTFMMRPRVLGADRDGDRGAGVLDVLSAAEAVGRVHRDRAHRLLAEVERHLDHEVVGLVVDRRIRRRERRQHLGQVAALELDVDDGSRHLDDLANGHLLSPWSGLDRSSRGARSGLGPVPASRPAGGMRYSRACAPVTISTSSRVIAA